MATQRVGLDTCCSYGLVVSEHNKHKLKEPKVVRETIFTAEGAKQLDTVVGKLGGAEAVAFGEVNLVGVGKLMKSLGIDASFNGDADKMELRYKGDVFYTGKFGEDCCPWGDLDQLIQSLEAIAMDNNLKKKKLLITLRSHAKHNHQGSSKDCKVGDSNFV